MEKQDPPTVSPGSSLSLTCTVNGVCSSGEIINEMTASNTLEWHIPYLDRRIHSGNNPGRSPFNNFSPLSLMFTRNCINGSLSSTLTFVAKRDFKNTPFQCALVIDRNHPLGTTDLFKVWSQAISLNGKKISLACMVYCAVCMTCTSPIIYRKPGYSIIGRFVRN